MNSRTRNAVSLVVPLVLCVAFLSGAAQEIAPGTIVDGVRCAADPGQTYAIYVPAHYSPDRQWSLLLAFHPSAKGRQMVETFQAAAEIYGYIVAASNNSRNGPFAISAAAAEAMGTDVRRRFAIDPQQVYLTGMSGGARVAMSIALAGNNIAGVIASSAGYPDSRPRNKVAFPIFGTAGTEDFNYLEMRLLDRQLSSPHFLAVFRGGHGMPPNDVGADALEWMTLQAMQSGRRPRDEAVLRRILEKRRAAIAASTEIVDTVYLLRAVVSDFTGMLDVSAEAARLDTLSAQPETKKSLKRQRDFEDGEERMLRELFQLEAALGDEGQRAVSLLTLRDRLSQLSRRAGADAATADRDQARRLLHAITFGAPGRVADQEYLALLEQYRARLREY